MQYWWRSKTEEFYVSSAEQQQQDQRARVEVRAIEDERVIERRTR